MDNLQETRGLEMNKNNNSLCLYKKPKNTAF